MKIVVYQVKDTIFWKQITTVVRRFIRCNMLFIKSKIQFFESKSQHRVCVPGSHLSCLSSQRYNFLKANHNTSMLLIANQVVVYQVKDTIFWKQITTNIYKLSIQKLLFIKSKIQFFESKSQLEGDATAEHAGCLSSQRYNFLKANHNSQISDLKQQNVVYQVKDTIFWKQITTWCAVQSERRMLFIKSKIQFFESKSQQRVDDEEEEERCLSSQRYNFLKANHNCNSRLPLRAVVVYQVKDTIFWKQITTSTW